MVVARDLGDDYSSKSSMVIPSLLSQEKSNIVSTIDLQ